METDIRKLVASLRPTADFESAVERTIDALNTRAEDIVVCDDDDKAEVEELRSLIDFWSEVQTNLKGERANEIRGVHDGP
jgi:hypothetical protein